MADMPWTRRQLTGKACAASLVLAMGGGLAAGARAHGGFFRAHDILIAPDAPTRMVVRSDVWGIVVSSDGGKRWHWSCAEGFGRTSTTPRRVRMVIAGDGRIAVASLDAGLMISDFDPCRWHRTAGLEGQIVRDVTVRSDGSLLVLTTRSEATGVVTQLFAAESAGGEVTRRGALPAGFTGTSLAVAPNDDRRVYVAGRSGGSVQVARSDDGGERWQLHTSTLPHREDEWEPRLAGLSPASPDLLLLWIDAFELGGGQSSPDAVLVSDDGGASLRAIFEASGDLPGLALAPDGETLLLAGPVDGLYRAHLAEALGRGEAAFVQLASSGFYGLTWNDAGIYAGMEEFAAQGPGYSLGISRDQGATFEPLMTVCQVTELTCAADTTAAALCPPHFSDMGLRGGGFKEDFLDTVRCQMLMHSGRADAAMPDTATAERDAGSAARSGAADAAMVDDAAPPATAAKLGSGAGCAARPVARRPLSAAGPLALLAGALWLRRDARATLRRQIRRRGNLRDTGFDAGRE